MHSTSRPRRSERGRKLRGPPTCPSAGRLGTALSWDIPTPQLTAGPSDNHLGSQQQALSQEASIPPGPPGHALRVTIFLLSVPRFACLDMVPTEQRRLASPRRSLGPRPLETPIQPSRGPSASGIDRLHLTTPAPSDAEHHGTCGSADQNQTTAPDSPTGSPALCSACDAASSAGLAAPFWPLGGIRTL